MKIFITGASGFVGGAAAKCFVLKGHEVIAKSRSKKGDKKYFNNNEANPFGKMSG